MENYAITTELRRNHPDFKIIEQGYTYEIAYARVEELDPNSELYYVINLDQNK